MVYVRAAPVRCTEACTLGALRKSNGFKCRCRSLICIAFNAFALEGSVIGHSKYELTAHGERLCKLKLKRFAVVGGVPGLICNRDVISARRESEFRKIKSLGRVVLYRLLRPTRQAVNVLCFKRHCMRELIICRCMVVVRPYNPYNILRSISVEGGKLVTNGKEFLAKPEADGVFNILPGINRCKRVNMYGRLFSLSVGNGNVRSCCRLRSGDINVFRALRRLCRLVSCCRRRVSRSRCGIRCGGCAICVRFCGICTACGIISRRRCRGRVLRGSIGSACRCFRFRCCCVCCRCRGISRAYGGFNLAERVN